MNKNIVIAILLLGVSMGCDSSNKWLYLPVYIPEGNITIHIIQNGNILYSRNFPTAIGLREGEDRRILQLDDCADYTIQINTIDLDMNTCGAAQIYTIVLHTPSKPYI
jgi:hypothetical protein